MFSPVPVLIPADVLGPVAMHATVIGPYVAPGAFEDEYVIRLPDGRTVALSSREFQPVGVLNA